MPDIVQVSLRGARKEFFLNRRNLWLRLGDRVVVQGEHGESLGKVHLKDPVLIGLCGGLLGYPGAPTYTYTKVNMGMGMGMQTFDVFEVPQISGWIGNVVGTELRL